MFQRTKLQIENRIALLSARTKDNGRIIQKLKREQRKFEASENLKNS